MEGGGLKSMARHRLANDCETLNDDFQWNSLDELYVDVRRRFNTARKIATSNFTDSFDDDRSHSFVDFIVFSPSLYDGPRGTEGEEIVVFNRCVNRGHGRHRERIRKSGTYTRTRRTRPGRPTYCNICIAVIKIITAI